MPPVSRNVFTFFHVFNCNELSLEVVLEKFIVRTEPEDLLICQMVDDEFLHLCVVDLAVLI